VKLDAARRLALALPEAAEQDHHDIGSFRVRGKIFATVPDQHHLRIMVDEDEIRAAVAANPGVCEEVYWGKRLSCVAVDLRRASKALVSELLTDAWMRRAPARLIDALSDR